MKSTTITNNEQHQIIIICFIIFTSSLVSTVKYKYIILPKVRADCHNYVRGGQFDWY